MAIEMNNKDGIPVTSHHSLHIEENEFLYLYAVEYMNGVQISIYDGDPKLGSLTMAYPIADSIERFVVFSGMHEMFASAVAQIVAKKRNKLVYCSINLKRDSVVSLDLIKKLIDKYFEK